MYLSALKTALGTQFGNVYYGTADEQNVWDYVVIKRDKITFNDNKTSKTHYIKIAIVRENFIPEGLEKTLIEKVTALPGIKLDSSDIVISQVRKPSTDTTVEVMVIPFIKGEKA